MRGQVTVEFVFLVVIILVIFTTVALPLVNSGSTSTEDASNALAMAAAQQKIAATADEVSGMACDSFKYVWVSVPDGPFVQGKLVLNAAGASQGSVTGVFFTADGTQKALKTVSTPGFVTFEKITGGACGPRDYQVALRKLCSSASTAPLSSIGWQGAGVGCP
jgi:hypothetical protein